MRRRRWAVALGTLGSVVALPTVFGHRGEHMLRGLVVPGAGQYGEATLLGVSLTLGAVIATVAWLRWGVGWLVGAVTAVGLVLAGATGEAHGSIRATESAVRSAAAHEFPIVVLVLAAMGWFRLIWRRSPFATTIAARTSSTATRSPADLSPVDRCRAASVAGLARSTLRKRASGPVPTHRDADIDESLHARLPESELPGIAMTSTPTEHDRLAEQGREVTGIRDDEVIAAITSPDVVARARRIGLAARARVGGDPLRIDHAHARTALYLWDCLDTDARHRYRADAASAWAGVVSSEPGWVRLLDGTLCARTISQDEPDVANRWIELLNSDLRLHRGRRPAWIWTPLGIAAGRPEDWEHATATALAHDAGWIDAGDWQPLRRRCLGAAARGTAVRSDERLIAAGRLWASLTNDVEATRLLARPTIARDPLAVAINSLATARTAGSPRNV